MTSQELQLPPPIRFDHQNALGEQESAKYLAKLGKYILTFSQPFFSCICLSTALIVKLGFRDCACIKS